MKTKFISAVLIAASCMMSCSKDIDETKDYSRTDKLSISPVFEEDSRAGFISKKDWAINDEMGLFVYKATGWGEAYPRYDKVNNRSTKTSNGWNQETPIYLLADEASIWAYYPYSPSATDGTRIPVSIGSNGTCADYMWGKSSNNVSVTDTEAIIPMKHALAQFVVRLKVSPEYHNDGVLSSAKLKATDAKFAVSGTMNLNDNGKITFDGTLRELAWAPSTIIPQEGSAAVDFNAAIFPMQVSANEVTLEVVIDGATYKYDIPTINWQAGNRYIYSITMHSDNTDIGGENGLGISIEPWIDNENDITLVPVK